MFPGHNFSSFIFHCAENWLLQMEAAKVVEVIADRRSIPFLINLLNDKENIHENKYGKKRIDSTGL